MSPRAQLVCYKTNLVILERQSRTLVKLQTVMLINVLIIILHDPIFCLNFIAVNRYRFYAKSLRFCSKAIRRHTNAIGHVNGG